MNLLIVKLIGGLGNQMFQYAFARALANKQNTEFRLDISGYEKQLAINTYREYELQCFNILEKIAEPELLNQYKNSKTVLLRKILNKLKLNFFSSSYILETAFTYDASIWQKKDAYFDGYWQSYKYFSDIREFLLREFTIKEPLDAFNQTLLESIKAENSVSIHIRRGDYVSNAKANITHGTCSLQYYLTAIEYLQKQFKEIKWFVFSDDIAWAKENLSLENAQFINHNQGKQAYKDLYLMSNCAHNIIANSSFSWWGAWLNVNPEKIVIAPKAWFKVNKDTSDLIPSEWKRM